MRDSQNSWRTLLIPSCSILCTTAAPVIHICSCRIPHLSLQCIWEKNSASTTFANISTAFVMDCRVPNQFSCHTRLTFSQEHAHMLPTQTCTWSPNDNIFYYSWLFNEIVYRVTQISALIVLAQPNLSTWKRPAAPQSPAWSNQPNLRH